MMPCELLDGNARIALNPDRLHARGAFALVEDSLTSYTCYMMPCLLSDGNARMDSNPDRVHLWVTAVKSCMPGPDKVRRHEIRPNFLCVVSVEKSERLQDPS